MKGWRQILLALAACLLLTAPAWAAEMDVGDEEAPVMVEYEGVAELFQCGSLTGEFTRPDEVNLFAGTVEQSVYDKIYDGLAKRNTTITISEQLELYALGDLIKSTYPRVVNDHPELFYATEGYNLRGSGTSSSATYTLTPTYRWGASEDEVKKFNAKLDEVVAEARAIDGKMEQMLWVHDYLAINCGYNWEVATGNKEPTSRVFSAYGVLVDRDAVCQGYALAYKLILNKLGINCITVTSTGMNHMWNLVQLDGSWYHVDVTWDDRVPDMQGSALHSYFLLSDSTISDSSHNHAGWSATAACSDKTYESGYIFNDKAIFSKVRHAVHFWNGSYYYVLSGNGSNSLYKSSSLRTEDQPPLTTISAPFEDTAQRYGTIDSGVVWIGDTLFYVDHEKNVIKYNLTNGVSRSIGNVAFTSQNLEVTINGNTQIFIDGIGLRYDSASDTIIARSATRRSDLGSFKIPKYSPEWDEDQRTVAILGLTDDGKTAGVKCETSGCTLWAAYYRNGRMIGAKCYPINGTGLQLVELGAKPSSYDNMKMMLLTAGHVPACEAYLQAS